MRALTRVVPVLVLLIGCDDDAPDAELPGGTGATVFTAGNDPANPFFRAVGSNGRTCASCHEESANWSVSTTGLRARFDATDGTDPVFRPVDGAVSPTADVSTPEARRVAYAMLLDHGVIRVGQPIPEGADFTLVAVSDPYGFASAAELSLFRRPLPSTNLRFVAQIMWDAREPSLDMQAMDATIGHAQAMSVDTDQMDRIVAFESSIYTAQQSDDAAGDLSDDGASGGPLRLVTAPFTIGLNDSNTGAFDRDVFTEFEAWNGADRSTAEGQKRAQIARGERIFNTERIRIRNVPGISDRDGTCSTCHDTPNVGSRSTRELLNLGISDANQRFAGLPLYTLRETSTGRTVQTSDPGAALVTGHLADAGKFKVPSLRGLAQRAPYFHNGMANNLDDVVRFYRTRFGMRLGGGEEADLVAFLRAL